MISLTYIIPVIREDSRKIKVKKVNIYLEIEGHNLTLPKVDITFGKATLLLVKPLYFW